MIRRCKMSKLDGFMIKIADCSWEYDAIDKLNYKTFVEEIPQHNPNPIKRLRDRFHHQNIYFICANEEEKSLAGMVAFRNKRPFSLDEKLENLDSYLPVGRSICEVRLLAIEKEFRYTRIAQQLIARLFRHAKDCGHDIGIISGTIRQVRLYEFLGFVPFGPVVGTKGAEYQPMYLTFEAYSDLLKRSRAFRTKAADKQVSDDTILFNFLPGPVDLPNPVSRVFDRRPCSHREKSFIKDFQKVRELLCDLVNSKHVEILMGSGTLANDAIAGQLSLLQAKGLILVSGEFGRRLVRNAKGAQLPFHVMEIPEGSTFRRDELEKNLDRHHDVKWIWGVHCETSTGVLHDIKTYKEVCKDRGIKLALDCISSIGTVPVDLSGVYLGSGTSGKGLASFSGLAMVFHNHQIKSSPNDLPLILDLGYYQEKQGIPFTIQSNSIYALLAALNYHDWKKRFEEINEWATEIRQKLEDINVPVVSPETIAIPSVVTISLPKSHSSIDIGNSFNKKGILVSYNSNYLVQRNWIQVCMMGAGNQSTDTFVSILKNELTN